MCARIAAIYCFKLILIYYEITYNAFVRAPGPRLTRLSKGRGSALCGVPAYRNFSDFGAL